MTHAEFIQFRVSFLGDCDAIITSKGKEYAPTKDDRFANFKRMGARSDVSPLKAANILLGKHLDSIDTYVKEGCTHSDEHIQKRFQDAVNYLILMAGMVHEMDEKANPIGP